MKEADLTFELYGTVVPKTVNNFAMLAHGVKAVIEGKIPMIYILTRTVRPKSTRFTLTSISRVVWLSQMWVLSPSMGPNLMTKTFT